jgi:tetratricopeptide (TPR) repeat protein
MNSRKYTVVLAASMVVGAALIFGTSLSVAQTQQQSNWCAGKDNATPDLQISGCTALVQSGKYTGKELADFFFFRGVAHAKKGDQDRAMSDYNEAIRITPNFPHALINVGLIYCRKGDDDRSIQSIKRALELTPGNAGAHLQFASVYYKTGDYPSAIASYSSFLQLQPDHPVGLYGRGVAKQKLGDASADADTTAAKARDTDIASLWARYCVK